jgi:phage FluMu protein Com
MGVRSGPSKATPVRRVLRCDDCGGKFEHYTRQAYKGVKYCPDCKRKHIAFRKLIRRKEAEDGVSTSVRRRRNSGNRRVLMAAARGA